jgi:N-acetylglucosaminyldiphosphoundecaprenol N-acetyl-beta-D-mannosaminyltransferase
MIVKTKTNLDFHNVLRSAWLKLPDGVGILWAYRFLLSEKLKSRVTGVDFLRRFLELNVDKKFKVYLLGAEDGVAKNLAELYVESNIVGYSCASSSLESEHDVIDQINLTGADILFVAFGAPTQEMWINRNIHKLETVKIGMGVGGAFDFLTGKAKRSPLVFRKVGLEWLWRLIREPKRLMRIINATVVFPWYVLKEKLRWN